MARPVTEAATYQVFTARLPVDVSQALRERAARSGMSLNTLMIAMLRRALRVPPPRVTCPELERIS